MSMQDQLSDMLTRIRNAHAVYQLQVQVACSQLKLGVCQVLMDEGYIEKYETNTSEDSNYKMLTIQLKYHKGKPVIETLRRVSKSSLRVYCKHRDLPSVNEGLGVAIVSTSKGVMSAAKARVAGLGGEVLCVVF